MQTHTVFGGPVAREAPVWLNASLGLVRSLFEWIGVCIYLASAIVTAKMVRKICNGDGPTEEAKVPVSAYAGNVGWVALLTLLLSAAVGLVLFVPTLSFLSRHQLGSMTLSPYVTWPETLLMYLVIAYVMTPPTLRLIAKAVGRRPAAAAISMGRIIALALATCSLLLSLLASLVKLPGADERGDLLVLGYMNSLFVALPYVPLYIAFGLLAMMNDAQSVGEAGAEAPILERVDSGA